MAGTVVLERRSAVVLWCRELKWRGRARDPAPSTISLEVVELEVLEPEVLEPEVLEL